MTIMLCTFEDKPFILRLYGHEHDTKFHNYIDLFKKNTGSRQIIELEIDLVQTSCGYAVPYIDYKEERQMLNNWPRKQGKEHQKY